jgi:hypothetical protein
MMNTQEEQIVTLVEKMTKFASESCWENRLLLKSHLKDLTSGLIKLDDLLRQLPNRMS